MTDIFSKKSSPKTTTGSSSQPGTVNSGKEDIISKMGRLTGNGNSAPIVEPQQQTEEPEAGANNYNGQSYNDIEFNDEIQEPATTSAEPSKPDPQAIETRNATIAALMVEFHDKMRYMLYEKGYKAAALSNKQRKDLRTTHSLMKLAERMGKKYVFTGYESHLIDEELSIDEDFNKYVPWTDKEKDDLEVAWAAWLATVTKMNLNSPGANLIATLALAELPPALMMGLSRMGRMFEREEEFPRELGYIEGFQPVPEAKQPVQQPQAPPAPSGPAAPSRPAPEPRLPYTSTKTRVVA